MKVVLKLVLLLSVMSGSFALANESDQLKDFVNKYEETWQSHDAKRQTILGWMPTIMSALSAK